MLGETGKGSLIGKKVHNWGRSSEVSPLPLGREQQAMSKPTGDLACHSARGGEWQTGEAGL